MADEKPVQHTPAHQADDAKLFDPRHPAASAFAVAQPGAGVVANDVEERGQNLQGGTKADDAEEEYSDQRDVLAEQHNKTLREKSGLPADDEGQLEVSGDSAKAAGSGSASGSKDTAPKASRPASPQANA